MQNCNFWRPKAGGGTLNDIAEGTKVKLKDPQKEILVKVFLKEKTQELEALGSPDGIILTQRGEWGDGGIG